ncbi:hypothetical protein ACA910_005391 [Epithemia clementina (nom. ined.)]
MSRGDQRERDRAKNLAKQQQKAKPKGGDPLHRNMNDAAALQAKVAAKQQKAAMDSGNNNGASSTGPVARKKVDKKNESLDDLLSAGLKRVK